MDKGNDKESSETHQASLGYYYDISSDFSLSFERLKNPGRNARIFIVELLVEVKASN